MILLFHASQDISLERFVWLMVWNYLMETHTGTWSQYSFDYISFLLELLKSSLLEIWFPRFILQGYKKCQEDSRSKKYLGTWWGLGDMYIIRGNKSAKIIYLDIPGVTQAVSTASCSRFIIYFIPCQDVGTDSYITRNHHHTWLDKMGIFGAVKRM